MLRKRLLLLVLFSTSLVQTSAKTTRAGIHVSPQRAVLHGSLDRLQLQVTADDGTDQTGLARYTSTPTGLVTISRTGRVSPLRDGKTTIRIQSGELAVDVSVEVTGIEESQPVSFARDVIPVLSKAGCNQGACHASQYGKGSFKLSLFGFAPEQDHAPIVRDWQRRRISFIRPESSLILRKATMHVAHGGGRRFDVDSFEHQLLLEWLSQGGVGPRPNDATVVGMTVIPAERVYQSGATQQIRVIATYSDESQRDVTHLARYDSMGEGTASVTSGGLVTAIDPGQAPIMIRFQGQADVSMVLVPREEPADLASFQSNNFIDEKVREHWQRLGLQPAELCSDSVFIRRAFLDATGTLPTAEQIDSFLKSERSHKRTELVDELLGLTGDPARDVHVGNWSAYWALKWGDLLRNNRNKVGDGGMWALYNWMRASFRENKPIDQFVREIITAQGSIYANGPANYFKIATKAEDLAETTAQVFLGIRMQCARCHHHPFEVYSQADYYGLAAFFTRVGTKSSADFGALGRDSVVLIRSSGSIRHPRTRKTIPPTPLLSEPAKLDGVRDLRRPLADWLTAPDNRLFARNVVNRIWGYFMGTGLVEPIDDMRATNPASIPALLDALADDFTKSGYDMRHLMRQIMTSRVYQLASTPREENVTDTRFYLHYNVKRLPAEVLLDAIDDACGTQERFTGVPLGTRAIELPDSNYASYFLDTLGRPKRVVACECERTSTPNLAQVLHIANGELLQQKLTDKTGRIAKLVAAKTETDAAVTELYRATFSRLPSEAELSNARAIVDSSDSQQHGLEDLLWALINSREFLFNH